MKTKFLLIAISCTTLLFTSCEKDEMGDGGLGGGGGMQDQNTIVRSTRLSLSGEEIVTSDIILKAEE